MESEEIFYELNLQYHTNKYIVCHLFVIKYFFLRNVVQKWNPYMLNL